MLRRYSIFLVLIAGLIAVEPLLHNHPLQQNSIPDACAICATGTTPLPSSMPVLVVPQTVVGTLTVFTPASLIPGVSLSLPSRAPPA